MNESPCPSIHIPTDHFQFLRVVTAADLVQLYKMLTGGIEQVQYSLNKLNLFLTI